MDILKLMGKINLKTGAKATNTSVLSLKRKLLKIIFLKKHIW
jgi:hypothetical protein